MTALGEPLGPFVGLGAADAELARPAADARQREEVHLAVGREVAHGRGEEAAGEHFADEFERPHALLPAPAEEGVDDLEEQVFEEVRVLLEHAGRDEQLPRPGAAVLDAVQQVRLARALVAEDRDDLGVRRRVRPVLIDDREEQFAFGLVEVVHVEAGADVVVRVAGEVVPKRVAGPTQGGAVRQVSHGAEFDGEHGNPSREYE